MVLRIDGGQTFSVEDNLLPIFLGFLMAQATIVRLSADIRKAFPVVGENVE